MNKKAIKIILSHREVEVKLFLEVLAVFAIFAFVLTGINYLDPSITGFMVVKEYDYGKDDLESKESDGIITTMLSLVSVLIIFMLIFNIVASVRRGAVRRSKKVRKKHVVMKISGKHQRLLTLKKKQEAKAGIELKKKLDGKSRKFVICHKLLLKANAVLQNNDIYGAKKLYLKTRELYTKLEYWEKKDIYDDIRKIYTQLSKGKEI